jgi:DNA-binding IscR family transcriptional regulator
MGNFEETKPTTSTSDPWLVIPVLAAISDAFCNGKTRTVDQIADQLHLAVTAVTDVTEALVKQGLLHRLDREDGAPQLVLALPPDQIDIGQLIDSTHPEIAEDSPGYALLKQIAAAQKKAIGDMKLGRRSQG